MPRVKIDTPGVSVELDATEASITELGKQAMDMFREAVVVNGKQPAGLAYGFSQEKRWTPDLVNGSRVNAQTQ
jgi:hypothetical protein